jgi:NAD(P)-dependent dehydrogenase (short-subunit alcohol dehydrogenase family)
MNPLLEGKVAVVTGGSSGIGRAAALAFAREGAHVAIGARRQTEGEETERMVREAGGQAVFVQTDVSHTEQVQRLIQAAVERWGRLDCALNNAGVERTLLHERPRILHWRRLLFAQRPRRVQRPIRITQEFARQRNHIRLT